MSLAGLILRGSRLEWRRQRLLAEAATKLVAASAGVRFLPFRKAIRAGSVAPRRAAAAAANGSPEECVWAIEAAARHLPLRVVCIHKGIALQHMLRRRGLAARLHYGVSMQPGEELAAHVWISLDGRTLLGGAEAPRFKCLAVYP